MSGQNTIELVFSRPRFAIFVATACVTGLGLLAAGWFAGAAAGARASAGVSQTAPASPPVTLPAAEPVSTRVTTSMTMPSPSVEAAAVPQYVVQTGSFRERAEAEKLGARLAHSGYAAETTSWKDSEDREWWIVRVGPYQEHAAAAQAASELGHLTRSRPLVRVLNN